MKLTPEVCIFLTALTDSQTSHLLKPKIKDLIFFDLVNPNTFSFNFYLFLFYEGVASYFSLKQCLFFREI